ncbi:MAG: hypothetical protein HGN29_17505 [Asgard group archaeon]|nr:hypothetical protein [Asgard group archaeon]
MIIIDELFVSSHPGYRLLHDNIIIDEKRLPVFLDYISLVFQKFNFYVEKENLQLVFGSAILEVIDYLRTLCESDEPEIVFETRRKLREILPRIRGELKLMGSCFLDPPSIQQFYEDIASALQRSSEYLMGDY